MLPRWAVGDSGTLHVTWSEFSLPEGWPPVGVFYTRSDDGSGDWLAPEQLSDTRQSYSNLVSVGENEIHVVWDATDPSGRFHRWSRDGGRSWSELVKLSPDGGMTQGWPSVAADSAGRVHFAGFGGGSAGERWSDMWYHKWDRSSWSQPFLLSPGESGWYTGYPSMVSTNGNEIHIAWSTWDPGDADGRENRPGVWYRRLVTSSPRAEALGVPQISARPNMSGGGVVVRETEFLTSVPTARSPAVPVGAGERGTPEPVSTPVPTGTREQSTGDLRTVGSAQTPVVIGLVPVITLILLVILAKSVRLRQ